MKYILAILIFGVIILIHEFGHFFTAKLFNIKVNQFAVGMGPRLLKKQVGETEYSLRLVPLGGFCAMEGEDAESESDRAFGKKKVWQRMIVIVAGAVMNMILGFVILVILTAMSLKVPTTRIAEFHHDEKNHDISSSFGSGLRVDDEIEEIDGIRILTLMDLQYALVSGDDTYDVIVERDGKEIHLENVIFEDKVNGGVLDFKVYGEEKNPLNVTAYAAKETVSTVKLVWNSLIGMITGQYSLKDMSGPVGVVTEIGKAADSGESTKDSVMSILSLASIITINLGVFNMLPLPALDGGRFFFLLVEAIRRKPIKPEHEGIVHLIGMALMVLLFIVVTFSDITKLFG